MLFSSLALVSLWIGATVAVPRPQVIPVDPKTGTSIKNSYIVVYKPGVTDAQAAKHEAAVTNRTDKITGISGVGGTFQVSGVKAYTVETDKTGIQLIANSGLVSLIEEDGVVSATAYTKQNNATWGLQRVSHRYSGVQNYMYDDTAGSGTFVYVLDTGVLTGHADFKGRASWGANFVNGTPDTDENGHGTHCAGTIGGSVFGVAKKTNIIAVKVLDKSGGGSYSNVINGLNWVANDVQQKGRTGKAVASLSLAGGFSSSLNSAVNALYQAGIPVIVAAGNNGADASNYSPASAQYAITIGASDQQDNKPSWSNFGSVVNIWAPGVGIMSDWYSCSTCVNTLSGTSMATPHVAGMTAYLMAKEGLKKPADLLKRLKYLAIANGAKNTGSGSNSDLLFNGNGDNSS